MRDHIRRIIRRITPHYRVARVYPTHTTCLVCGKVRRKKGYK